MTRQESVELFKRGVNSQKPLQTRHNRYPPTLTPTPAHAADSPIPAPADSPDTRSHRYSLQSLPPHTYPLPSAPARQDTRFRRLPLSPIPAPVGSRSCRYPLPSTRAHAGSRPRHHSRCTLLVTHSNPTHADTAHPVRCQGINHANPSNLGVPERPSNPSARWF